jgi:uncharacterized repeat protein (TIGR01451 family)
MRLAVLRSVAIVALGTALMASGLVPAANDFARVGEALAASTKTVQVMNGLPETLCDPTQWHWIINKIDTESHVPAYITVTWSNGTTTRVNLDKATPAFVGHYVSALHLADGVFVTNATVQIYSAWDGRFVLSCPEVTVTPTKTPVPPTSTPTKTPAPPTNTPVPPTATPVPCVTYTSSTTVPPLTGGQVNKVVLTINGSSPTFDYSKGLRAAIVRPGDTVVYQITVTGSPTTSPPAPYIVIDAVPFGTSFVLGSGPLGTVATYDATTHRVTYTNIFPDASGTFVLSLTLQVNRDAACGLIADNSAEKAGIGRAEAQIEVVSGLTTSTSISIWDNNTTPDILSKNDANAVELGMKFRSDTAGRILGVRFYKGLQNTGTHVGNLWACADANCTSPSGPALTSATFVGETASGWQTVLFASPVPIAASTTYLVSYHTDSGFYSQSLNYFTNAGYDNWPLHALQSTVASPNDVYNYGPTSVFPANSFADSNYWVDVVFAQ